MHKHPNCEEQFLMNSGQDFTHADTTLSMHTIQRNRGTSTFLQHQLKSSCEILSIDVHKHKWVSLNKEQQQSQI